MAPKTKEISEIKKPFEYDLGNLGEMEMNKEFKVKLKVTSVSTTDERGKKAKAVLMEDGRIAIIKKGSGLVAEQAYKDSGSDQGKYLSLMIAACTSIEGVHILVEDLRDEYSIADYQTLRNAFGEINF